MKDQIEMWRKDFSSIHKNLAADADDKGQADGEMGQPEVKQSTPSPTEQMIKASYGTHLASLQSKFSEYLQTAYEQFETLKTRLDRPDDDWQRETQEGLVDIQEKYQSKRESATEMHRHNQTRITDELNNFITKPFQAAKKAQSLVFEKEGRTSLDITMKNQRLYLFFLFLIGIAEFPINGITFGTIAETIIEQWLMAGTLAIGIPLSAHFAGISWKRDSYGHNKMIALVLTAIIVGLCIGLGEAREYVMFTSFGEEEVPIQKWVTVIISILLYVVGTTLAYSAHDSSPDMEEVVEAFREAKKEYDKKYPAKAEELRFSRESHVQKMDQINTEEIDDKHKMKERKQKDQEEKLKVGGQHDAMLLQLQAEENQIDSCFKVALSSYRRNNVLFRENHAAPTCFQIESTLKNDFVFANMAEVTPNPVRGRNDG